MMKTSKTRLKRKATLKKLKATTKRKLYSGVTVAQELLQLAERKRSLLADIESLSKRREEARRDAERAESDIEDLKAKITLEKTALNLLKCQSESPNRTLAIHLSQYSPRQGTITIPPRGAIPVIAAHKIDRNDNRFFLLDLFRGIAHDYRARQRPVPQRVTLMANEDMISRAFGHTGVSYIDYGDIRFAVSQAIKDDHIIVLPVTL